MTDSWHVPVFLRPLSGLACRVLIALAATIGAAQAQDRAPTVVEAGKELALVVGRMTPFTFRYEPVIRTAIFREMVESGDKSIDHRAGELRVRVDRLDPKRINFQAASGPFPLMVNGQKLSGVVNFFCLEGQRCVRRGFPDPKSGALDAPESDEAGFSIDIVEGVVIDELKIFASLMQILIGGK